MVFLDLDFFLLFLFFSLLHFCTIAPILRYGALYLVEQKEKGTDGRKNGGKKVGGGSRIEDKTILTKAAYYGMYCHIRTLSKPYTFFKEKKPPLIATEQQSK